MIVQIGPYFYVNSLLVESIRENTNAGQVEVDLSNNNTVLMRPRERSFYDLAEVAINAVGNGTASARGYVGDIESSIIRWSNGLWLNTLNVVAVEQPSSSSENRPISIFMSSGRVIIVPTKIDLSDWIADINERVCGESASFFLSSHAESTNGIEIVHSLSDSVKH